MGCWSVVESAKRAIQLRFWGLGRAKRGGECDTISSGVLVLGACAGAAMMHGLLRSIACGVMVIALRANAAPGAGAAPRKPDPRVATKAAAPDPKAVAAVNTAVAALVKEAQAGLKEGGSKDPATKLREKADYFGDAPPADITPEAVLAALEKATSHEPRA